VTACGHDMSISDNNPHCIEDLYAKYLQFTAVMLEEYKDIEIAGIMITQALSMYRTVLPEEDYQRMVKSIYERRNDVKTFDGT
jgi:hypothetical protein